MSDEPEDLIRNSKGQFAPGQVVHRNGSRPRVIRDFVGNKLSIEELYQSNAGHVFYELLKLIRDPKTTATARVSAIKEFNDRALGRPNQAVKVSNQNGDASYDTIDTSLLPVDVLQAILQARLTSGDR